MKYHFTIKSSFDLSHVIIDTLKEGYKGWKSYDEAEEYAEDIMDIGQLSEDEFYTNVIPIVELSDIVVGATLDHKLINDYLIVVSDDEAEGVIGKALSPDKILLSHAIMEWKAGNIRSIVQWKKKVISSSDSFNKLFDNFLKDDNGGEYLEEMNTASDDERVEEILREYK